jgi:ribosomal protein S18 acetylase RimI-like enzyme
MTIRRATAADKAGLQRLWDEFCAEVPEPPGFPEEDWSEAWAVIQKDLENGSVYVAEDGGALVAVAHVRPPERGVAHLEWAHVSRDSRRRGVLRALLAEAVEETKAKGASLVTLEVLKSNGPAIAVWRRLGFDEVEYVMAAPLEALERRLAARATGPSHASTHVQTDDRTSVERALAQFVPRLESPDVRDAANGWIRIADPLLDVDRDAQSRFARDLSDRLGAVVVALAVEQGAVVRFRLYERGRMVDEYLSVPDYYGRLPKGDELALAANPTLVARLTGAPADEIRSIVRNADSPEELPPAEELYTQIAGMMGLEP